MITTGSYKRKQFLARMTDLKKASLQKNEPFAIIHVSDQKNDRIDNQLALNPAILLI